MTINFGTGYEDSKQYGTVTRTADNSVSLLETTMAQSAYFKVQIERIASPVFKNLVFDDFLPVKSMSITPVALEMMTIPVGIFGDMSIVTRRKLGKLSITLLDDNTDYYEQALQDWFDISVPAGGFVGYMDDIVSDLTYTSYSTTGLVNRTLTYKVMLSDEMSVSRDYEANELKTITFGLVIVGTVG